MELKALLEQDHIEWRDNVYQALNHLQTQSNRIDDQIKSNNSIHLNTLKVSLIEQLIRPV
jgi:hypothetical protein